MFRRWIAGSAVGLFATAGGLWAQQPAAPVATPAPTIVESADAGPGVLAGAYDYQGDNLMWGGAEYLLWWIKKAPVDAPIVLQSPVDAFDNAGVLGQPGVTVLFPGHNDSEPMSGGRFTLGMWLDPEATVGAEVSGFFLGRRATGANFASDAAGTPALGFAFNNVTLNEPGNGENFYEASLPNELAGAISIRSSSALWGTEANLVLGASRNRDCGLRLLGGFRYLNLEDSLQIGSIGTVLPPGPLGVNDVSFLGNDYAIVGASTTTLDSIDTRNQFYGGQIGAEATIDRGCWFATLTGKVALGNVHESVNIAGSSSLIIPGAATVTAPGGFFALPSNIGHYRRDRFAVLPETEVKIGYNVTPRLSLFVAYDLLYLSETVRPGNQIDRNINLNNVPTAAEFGAFPGGPNQPAFNMKGSDFWAQGVSFGVGFRF